jgi:protein-tyrosine phosphatase
MPELLDWQSIAVQRNAACQQGRALARALARGHLLVVPAETGYLAVTSALLPGAVERLRRLASLPSAEPLEVGVWGGPAARDWGPRMGPIGQRLARRLWPGPLVLACSAEGASLAGQLPAAVRSAVCPGNAVRLRCPNHEAIFEMIRESPVPLVLASLPATSVRQLPAGLAAEVDVIIDDGPTPYTQPPTVVAVDGEEWSVIRPGLLTQEQILGQAANLIVFVCTGNTCRSPLAEALCKKRLAERLGCRVEELPGRGYVVTSAGLATALNLPAAPEAIAVAGDRGADLTNHRSKPLSADLAARADHLIAMTTSHLCALRDHYPALGTQPCLLSALGHDLADPVGQPRAVYEECAVQIDQDLDAIVATLSAGRDG